MPGPNRGDSRVSRPFRMVCPPRCVCSRCLLFNLDTRCDSRSLPSFSQRVCPSSVSPPSGPVWSLLCIFTPTGCASRSPASFCMRVCPPSWVCAHLGHSSGNDDCARVSILRALAFLRYSLANCETYSRKGNKLKRVYPVRGESKTSSAYCRIEGQSPASSHPAQVIPNKFQVVCHPKRWSSLIGASILIDYLVGFV